MFFSIHGNTFSDGKKNLILKRFHELVVIFKLQNLETMISQTSNEYFGKKLADLKELVIKENRLIQNDLEKIFKSNSQSTVETLKKTENATNLEINIKDIEKMFQEARYDEIIRKFRYFFTQRKNSIKSEYLNYLTKSLVKLVNY
jgi:hypothetical protein